MATDEFGIDWGDAEAAPPSTPSVGNVEAATHTPTDETAPSAVGEMGKDLLYRGVLGGIEQAGRGVAETVRAGANLAGADLPELPDQLIDAPESTAGQIVRDITQFGLGFVGGMNLLRVTGAAAKLAPVVKEIVASGIGTGVVADPNAPRLANLIQKYPYLENPITEYLATDAGDGVGESKFKAALEDMLVTPAAMTLFKTMKGIKSALSKNGDQAKQLADEIVQDAKLGADSAAGKVDLKLPEVKVTPDDVVPETSTPEASATNAKGEAMFSLTGEQKTLLTKQIDAALSAGNTDDLGVIFKPVEGIFNYQKMESQFEVQRTMQALADMIKPSVDRHVGGVQTLKETKELADLFGTKPEIVTAALGTWAKNADDMAATVVAGKALAQTVAHKINQSLTRIHNGVASEVDSAETLRLIDILADIEGMTKSVQTAAARTTSAGRIRTTANFTAEDLKSLMGEGGGKDLKKLAERVVMSNGDPKSVIKILRASWMEKLIDTHNEVWINGILSGPKTHVVNVMSAATNTLLQPFNQIVGGAILRTPQEVQEGLAVYRGLRTNFFDSLEMAARAFRTERSIIDPGKTTDEIIEKALSAKNWNLDENGWLGHGVDWLGTVARMPSRFLKAEDEFFKQINYRSKVMARASREAAGLVQDGKLEADKAEQYIQDRFQSAFSMEELTKDAGLTAGKGTDKAALGYAREATFTQDLNDIKTGWFGNPGARLQQFAASHPWMRGTILPFIKVPTNIMRSMADYTPPLAMMKREGMDILTSKETDPTKRAAFAGRLATGSMLWGAAVMMAIEGRVTGSAYGDKDMRNRQMESGWQPYSFVFTNENGKKEYISFQRLDPYGMFFGLAADFTYIAQHLDDSTKHDWATLGVLAVAKNLSSKSYLQGLVEQASMLGGGYTAEEHAKKYVQNRVASYVPAYANLYTGNDELKEIRTLTDALMAKIPGMTDKVEARRDYFGEKRMAPMGFPWNAVDPFPVSEEKDAVRKELARLSRSEVEARFTMPEKTVGTVDLTQIKNAKGQTAYDRWTELVGTVEMGGQTFHEKLASVIESPRYKDGTDGTSAYHAGNRVVMIRNEQEKYRQKALREMLLEFDDAHAAGQLPFNLRDMVRQDSRNERAVKRGKVDAVEEILNLNR